jgi:serine/threonine-protein kinase
MIDPAPSQRDLFEAALALPQDQRVAWLAEHCVDPGQRGAIARMLAADADAHAHMLDHSFDQLLDHIGTAELEESMPVSGTRIGPFTLREQLGEGGSSIVYRAEREQAGVKQSVALKLLRRSLYTPDEQRRFRDERRALAQLRHPGIARLIEGGFTDAGVAYIALELVEGEPITAFADHRRLGLRQRLGLFIHVCRAVEAAHRALIVHRDLKPSNVLVTHDGEVKLLDFGIAKLLDANAHDDPTHTQYALLTPAYAAPEQFAGGPITTATDVYALGVLLDEMITGQRREHGDTRTPSSRISQITALHAPVSLKVMRRQLRGDLDNIVVKATAPEPEQRYSSAGTLADDIERHLAGELVTAHPLSSWYRTRKFVARHRGGVLMSTLFAIAVLAALGLAMWQADVARREAARANTVRDFVEGMFEPIREGVASGKQPSLAELVDKGAQRVESTSALGTAERVDLLLMFSRLYDYLNERSRMQALADRAGALADATLGVNDPRALDAAVARATAALRRGDYAQAGKLLDEAERRLRTSGDRGDPWIRVQDGLAAVTNSRGDPVQTLLHGREALAARIAAYGEASEEAGGGYANLGFALEGAGQFTDAAEAYRRAYAGRVAHGGAQTARSATTLGSLGASELMAGDVALARKHLRDALAVFDQLGGKPSAAHAHLVQQHCLAELVTASPLAQSTCARAVDIARRSDDGVPAIDTGLALRLQGLSLLQGGDVASARKALDSSQALLAEKGTPIWQGRTDIALGELALAEGKPAQAAQQLALGVQKLGAGYPPYLRSDGLALLALACRDTTTTPICQADAADVAHKQLEQDAYRWNPLLLAANVALARIDLADSHTDRAADRLRSAIEHAGDSLEPTQPYLLDARLWLAIADARAGRCDRARAGARDALVVVHHLAVNPHPLLTPALAALNAVTSCGSLSG